MEHQSHVTVSVPVSLEDAEHTELAKDIKKSSMRQNGKNMMKILHSIGLKPKPSFP